MERRIGFKNERLRAIRKKNGLTQKEFSEKIGCTMASLSAYENGSKIPPTQTLLNLADQFSYSIDWLLGLSDLSQHSTQTYSEFIQRLLELQDFNITMIKNCECVLPSDKPSFAKGIAFYDTVIGLFLKSWQKTYSLYEDGTIDDVVYGAWKEKVIRDFNYPILNNDNDWEDFAMNRSSLGALPGISEYDAVLEALHATFNQVSIEFSEPPSEN